MPLYEYKCDDCGVRFERRQRMADDPISVCPECKGSVHRVVGPVGIVFKGSGFYVTDNRKKRGRASSSTSSASESSTSESASKNDSTSSKSSESPKSSKGSDDK